MDAPAWLPKREHQIRGNPVDSLGAERSSGTSEVMGLEIVRGPKALDSKKMF